MQRTVRLAALAIALCLTAACGRSSAPVVPQAHPTSQAGLPTGVLTITTDGSQAVLPVEIAETEATRETGLMGRTDLAPDSGMVFLCSMVEHGDTLYFYYDGWDREHGDLGPARPAIGLATLRLDGFASLDPVGARGTVVTRPFVLEGDALRVNAYARRGKILVEVLDASGRVRPGFSASDCKPVTEDGLRLRVRWQKRALSELRSQVIRLRFHLRGRAELYAFQIDRAGE